jgi:hypothetical protein
MLQSIRIPSLGLLAKSRISRAIPCWGLVCVIAIGLPWATPAKASVVYDLTATSTTGSLTGNGGAPISPLDWVLTLPNAVVASGSYSASRTCDSVGCRSVVGDFTGFSLISGPLITLTATPDPIYDDTAISLTFDNAGNIISGTITEGSSLWTMQSLAIRESSWSISDFNTDASPWQRECKDTGCTANGVVTLVSGIPEAPSLDIFGVGLLVLMGFGWVRWKRGDLSPLED